jgi:CheY-like chemotaxis protein
MTTSPEQVVRVLIVEDNPADVYITRLALAKEMNFEAVVVDDGAPAITYLNSEPPYESTPTPDLVILDLNLKTIDGLQVLRWIRAKPDLLRLPVVVLSSFPPDAQHDAAAQASCYIQKPGTLDEYIAIGRVIRQCLEEAQGPAQK